MIRLTDETATNLRFCELVIPVYADHARWVLAVVRALNDGYLSDANLESFDAGLIRPGYISGAAYSMTATEAMIATGWLKDLENTELRKRIVELPLWIKGARDWTADTRG